MSPIKSATPLKVSFLMLLLLLNFLQEVSGQKKKGSSITAYGNASYKASANGEYMKDWLLLGPFHVKEGDTTFIPHEIQQEAFDTDVITKVAVSPKKLPETVGLNGKSYPWKAHTSAGDIIDLDEINDKIDFAAVYALAEIMADSSYTALLAIGSDDGIKVWHNGALIHKNFVGRGLIKDQDLIPVKLIKGSNQLLLKVQDINQAWGFSARLLDQAALSEQLFSAASAGWLDQISLLVNAGADVNAKDAGGLTALHLARISGREAMEALLIKNGAKITPMPSEEEIIDHYYKELNAKEAPGVSVLIAKGGKAVYRKGFGYRDIKNKAKVSPETIFRIGSVTKQFTAAGILKLQEKGLLSVDDKLSKFMPDFPRADEVTIHHLLTHTSGIHSYTSKPDFIKKVEKPVSPTELINYFKNDPYDFNPGEEFRYNNSGYFLLGHIIELVSGQTYGTFLKEQFFDPLEMNHTGVHRPGLKLKNEALGYGFADNKYDASVNWDMSWAGGAGALYSTTDDLLKWNNGLNGGKVINFENLKAAYTPVKLNNGQKPQGDDYGYGFGIGNYRGKKLIQHGGGLHGFVSHLAYYPEEDLTVIMFTNVAPPQAEFDSKKLAEIYLWKNLEKQKSFETIAYSSEELKKYEGRYDFGNGAVMIITSENESLYARLTGQPKFEIFPSAEDEFFWKVVEARIHFSKDENGNVPEAMFYQNGMELKIKRMEEVATINPDPALYDQYVGKYDIGNNILISITKEKDKIFAQGTNQPKFEIFPVSLTEFILKDINARITFIQNEQGATEKLVLNMQGQDTDAPKIE